MISHHHKTIFVHIPKCGGQSIEHMFLEDLGLTWETREPLLLRPNTDPGVGPPRLAHLLARDYVALGHVSQEDFDRYFKFAVVRNPYDRVLSLFNYLKINRPRAEMLRPVVGERISRAVLGEKPLDLDRFVFDYLPGVFAHDDDRGEVSRFWFVRRQSDYVLDAEENLLVDRIVHLEALKEDVADLRARAGLKSDLRHVNKSRARATPQNLRAEHLDVIEDLYDGDFALFGYDRRSR